MNIFVPYSKAGKNAKALDSLRLSKMLMETAQLLCSTLHYYNVPDVKYAKTHVNHPCAVWARESRANFRYLVHLGFAIEKERLYRGMNPHKSFEVIRHCNKLSWRVPKRQGRTPFVNCCTHHKHVKDVHLAYQLELKHKWENDIKAPRWGRRGPPKFLNQ